MAPLSTFHASNACPNACPARRTSSEMSPTPEILGTVRPGACWPAMGAVKPEGTTPKLNLELGLAWTLGRQCSEYQPSGGFQVPC